jgi:hypothetical protein
MGRGRRQLAASFIPKGAFHGRPQTKSLISYFDDASCRFQLPATLMNVQHSLDDDPDVPENVPENEYEVITCLACTKLHLINRKPGQILGQPGPRR